ncbi:hypothetical protein NEOLI_005453, partial [Neolecta irregularis DAH-3]
IAKRQEEIQQAVEASLAAKTIEFENEIAERNKAAVENAQKEWDLRSKVTNSRKEREIQQLKQQLEAVQSAKAEEETPAAAKAEEGTLSKDVHESPPTAGEMLEHLQRGIGVRGMANRGASRIGKLNRNGRPASALARTTGMQQTLSQEGSDKASPESQVVSPDGEASKPTPRLSVGAQSFLPLKRQREESRAVSEDGADKKAAVGLSTPPVALRRKQAEPKDGREGE